MLLQIPAEGGETSRVWAYVLSPGRKLAANKILVVIDHLVVINRDPTFRSEAVVVVDMSTVIGHIPAGENRPLLSVVLTEGALLELRRTDGKTAPLTVAVDQDNSREIWSVTHQSGRVVRDNRSTE